MKVPKFLAQFWDERDAERGFAAGLLVASIVLMLFGQSDWLALRADWLLSRNPYGVLWNLINPLFYDGTLSNLFYRVYTVGFCLAGQAIMYYFFVRTKRMSKFIFYIGWLIDVVWMRGTIYQNLTVTTFAPLLSLGGPYLLVLVFILFQKLPIVWSFPDITANAHWQCAFNGVQHLNGTNTITNYNGLPLVLCPGPDIRWNITLPWFWSYAFLVVSVAFPLLWWFFKAGGLHRIKLRLAGNCPKCELPKEWCVCGLSFCDDHCRDCCDNDCQCGGCCGGDCHEGGCKELPLALSGDVEKFKKVLKDLEEKEGCCTGEVFDAEKKE